MGLTTITGRRFQQMNDNVPPVQVAEGVFPISPDEFRHPPFISVEAYALWYCLVTMPQREYACCECLSDRGVACFAPTETKWVERRKGSEKQRHQIQVPIFRSYVFARIARPQDWEPIYTTRPAHRVEYEDGYLAGLSGKERHYAEMLQSADRRNDMRRNPYHILGVVGVGGRPMPISAKDLGPLADEERAGWFNEDMRPALLKAERLAKLKASQAEDALREAMKPKPDFLAGEKVRIVSGLLAGEEAVAENDNTRGVVRLVSQKIGRIVIPVSDLENLTRPKVNAGDIRRAAS